MKRSNKETAQLSQEKAIGAMKKAKKVKTEQEGKEPSAHPEDKPLSEAHLKQIEKMWGV